MEGYGKKYHLAVGWNPIDKNGGGQSDVICMKGYEMAEFWIITGAAVTATAAVTMFQGTSVAAAATALAFTRYFDSGCHLAYDGGSVETPAAAGETAIGASTASGYVYTDTGGKSGVVTLYGRDETAYVDNEVLTFSGGKTAVVNGVLYDEDIMVPRVATGNTFDITLVHDANRRFMVPISAAMLTPPNDCVALTIGDPSTPSLMCCFVVLTECRYANMPMPTAIYN
jgi:hypothetical protein